MRHTKIQQGPRDAASKSIQKVARAKRRERKLGEKRRKMERSR